MVGSSVTMADLSSQKFVAQLDLQSGNVEAAWKRFKEQFDVYFTAKGMGALDAEVQVANMVVLMEPDALPIYSKFVSDGDKTVKTLKEKFDAYFQPVKNVIFKRVKFNRMIQGPEQSIHDFITELRVQADNCEYGEMRDQVIRDRIVVGVSDRRLTEMLTSMEALDLTECIKKAKQFTSQQEHMACYATDDKQLPQNMDYFVRKEQKRKPQKRLD